MPNPTIFFDVAEAALGCICGSMETLAERSDLSDYPGCPCRAYVSPVSPPFDACCDNCDSGTSKGQLTVHVEEIFPTDNFPSRSAVIHPCKATSYAALIVVTVARCSPQMKEGGNPPTEDAIALAARNLAIDRMAVIDGLTCCLPDLPPPGKRRRRVQLINVRNLSENECLAFEARAYVDAGIACSCTEVS